MPLCPYEDVTDVPRRLEIIVDPPVHGKVKHYAMIEYSWTGDSQATHMQLDELKIQPQEDIQRFRNRMEFWSIASFEFPLIDMSSIGMQYLWAKSVFVANGIPYYSQSRMYTQGEPLDYSITGSYKSGTLTTAWTTPRAISFGSGQMFFISAAYKGYYADAYYSNSQGTVEDTIYLKDADGESIFLWF